MDTQIEIHKAQAQILKVLLFKPQARFRDLNVTGLTTDHFTFHLKQLLESGLIDKSGNGYQLTVMGKEFANRFDTETAQIERQAKLGVAITGIKIEGKTMRFLVQQRLKQPYYGYYGSITGKVRWGETVEETAKREFLEETGLAGKFELMAIKHKMDYSQDNKMLEDKFFFVFKVVNPTGKLITDFEGGRNQWLTKKEIVKLQLFPDYMQTFKIIKQKTLAFVETKYIVPSY